MHLPRFLPYSPHLFDLQRHRHVTGNLIQVTDNVWFVREIESSRPTRGTAFRGSLEGLRGLRLNMLQ